jgi:hypothetical protein
MRRRPDRDDGDRGGEKRRRVDREGGTGAERADEHAAERRAHESESDRSDELVE